MPDPKDVAYRTERRNLLVVRAGDDSLHPGWVQQGCDRSFDLLVSYYGTEVDQHRAGADYYHVMQGPRWPAHDAICRANRTFLEHYDFVGFACDDLMGEQSSWDALFAICGRHGLDLAQPAIEGHVSHPITEPVPGSLLRRTNFVEIMCPVFSRRALAELHLTFGESRSGWGLDVLWATRLDNPQWRLAVIDAVRVRHSRPLHEGPLYSLLKQVGVSPRQELIAICARLGLEKFHPRELSRID